MTQPSTSGSDAAVRPSLFTYLTAETHASGFSSASSVDQVVTKYGCAKRTVLVTGSSSAVGSALCGALCRGGATVLMGYWPHSETKTVALAEMFTKENADVGGCAIPVLCELSSVETVQRSAAEIQALCMRLHAVVHCAATTTADCILTPDNVESHFAVNYLNPLLLTLLLLPFLGQARRSSGGPVLPVSSRADREGVAAYAPRVVWCSCSSHHITYMPETSSSGCILAWRVVGEAARAVFMSAQAFGQSKLATIMVAKQLATRAAAAGHPLAVFAVHPGVTQEGLTRYGGYPTGSWFHGLKAMLAHGLANAGCLKSPTQAASSLAFALLDPGLLDGDAGTQLNVFDTWAGSVVGAAGALSAWGYIEDCCLANPSSQAKSVLNADRLWQMSESLLVSSLGIKTSVPLLSKPLPQPFASMADKDPDLTANVDLRNQD